MGTPGVANGAIFFGDRYGVVHLPERRVRVRGDRLTISQRSVVEGFRL